MFLRFNRRFKDGKEHRYWNVVENKRCAGGRVVQRQVLYLGEINDGQREAWCELIEAFDGGGGGARRVGVVARRSRRSGVRGGSRHAGAARCDGAASAAAMGCMLVGVSTV